MYTCFCLNLELVLLKCGYSLMVGRVLAKDELGVRFSLPAQEECIKRHANSFVRIFVRTTDQLLYESFVDNTF